MNSKKSWSSAKQEAAAAFGNDDMYIENLFKSLDISKYKS